MIGPIVAIATERIAQRKIAPSTRFLFSAPIFWLIKVMSAVANAPNMEEVRTSILVAAEPPATHSAPKELMVDV